MKQFYITFFYITPLETSIEVQGWLFSLLLTAAHSNKREKILAPPGEKPSSENF